MGHYILHDILKEVPSSTVVVFKTNHDIDAQLFHEKNMLHKLIVIFYLV